MTKEEKEIEIKRINAEMEMLRAVRRGEEVKCPYCSSGVLREFGYVIKCDNDNCNARWALDFA